MVKTVQLDIPLNILVGLGISWMARGRLVREESVLNKYFLVNLLYAVFVFAPVGFFLYYNYTDWSLMYFVDPKTLDASCGVAAGYGYIFGSLAGFYAGWICIKRGRADFIAPMAIAVSCVLGLYTLVTLPRLLNVGTYAQYHSDYDMPFILFTRLFLHLLWIGAYCGLPLYLIWRKLSGEESVSRADRPVDDH